MEESSDIFSFENIRNNWLKFFKDLFRHVLQETEAPGVASDCAPGFESECAPGVESESTPGFESESTPGFESECAPGVESECASGRASTPEFKSGFVTSSGYAAGEGLAFNFSDLFHSYDRKLGSAISRLLVEVAGADIDSFYQSIREKIRNKENLKVFLNRLTDKFLNGSPPLEMYFLAIISRIFYLIHKTGDVNPKTFIEAVTDTIFEGGLELQLASSINTHELVLQILRDAKDWIREFRDLKCGDASEYF